MDPRQPEPEPEPAPLSPSPSTSTSTSPLPSPKLALPAPTVPTSAQLPMQPKLDNECPDYKVLDQSQNQRQSQSQSRSRAMANFRALVFRIAASDPTRPLTPARRSLIGKRLSQFFPDAHTPRHPTYSEMIHRAIQELNEKGGSSEESISNFIKNAYEDLPWAHSAFLKHHLSKLCDSGDIAISRERRYLFGDATGPSSRSGRRYLFGAATGPSFRTEQLKTKQKRGRPRKKDVMKEEDQPKEEEREMTDHLKTKQRRGRPRKKNLTWGEGLPKQEEMEMTDQLKTKWKSGRPRKQDVNQSKEEEIEMTGAKNQATAEKNKEIEEQNQQTEERDLVFAEHNQLRENNKVTAEHNEENKERNQAEIQNETLEDEPKGPNQAQKQKTGLRDQQKQRKEQKEANEEQGLYVEEQSEVSEKQNQSLKQKSEVVTEQDQHQALEIEIFKEQKRQVVQQSEVTEEQNMVEGNTIKVGESLQVSSKGKNGNGSGIRDPLSDSPTTINERKKQILGEEGKQRSSCQERQYIDTCVTRVEQQQQFLLPESSPTSRSVEGLLWSKFQQPKQEEETLQHRKLLLRLRRPKPTPMDVSFPLEYHHKEQQEPDVKPNCADDQHNSVTDSSSMVTAQPPLANLHFSIGECIECLDEIEAIEKGSDLYFFALDIFLKKERRETFLQLKDSSVRLAWLQRMQSIGNPLVLG
ncbi:hypothetical protein NMG60_11023656 [Bertholletia excelsa]